ncbi:MAG: four helix bundle protein [Candidatus Margulisbacteria bacterium]|nr:four helix bundle protein [Candidatus Margulisiibacteriota bacterium]
MEIQNRTLKFAIRSAKFVKIISRDLCFDVLIKQLLRSSTSIGANMREADSASSKKDFAHKVNISKKEAQETEYWLEILKDAEFVKNDDNKKELKELLVECREIIKVLAAIIHKAKAN